MSGYRTYTIVATTSTKRKEMESTLEQKTYTVELTATELGYFYWRMKTNRWYERYVQKGMKQMPWEPWMAKTLDKLTPLYNTLK